MKDDGGFAFPTGDQHNDPGMTLRDWFAGMALQGILASHPHRSTKDPGDDTAHEACAWADRMIKERQKS
jgi:hypothetical protein